MKRIYSWLLLLLILVIAGYIFYFQFLRGLKPVLLPPNQDVTKILNTTGMPLTLPPGYSIEIFAKDLGAARVLATDPEDTVLVSSLDRGAVYAIVEGKIVTVANKLNQPHGLAFKCADSTCTLFVAETDKLIAFDYNSKTKQATNKKMLTALPAGGLHVTRSLLVNPIDENQLLIAIGSTCNVCRESNPQRAAISTLDLTTKKLSPFATGLRNSVFQTVNPGTNDIWATEMGRDSLGDDLPPDEINVIWNHQNYGWPNCYGKNIHDIQFDKNTYIRNPCQDGFEKPSYIDLPAHSAPLGLAFLEPGKSLLVALHGSWNRSVPTGYKIVKINLENGVAYKSTEDFITGWLRPDGTAIGRPVDILVQGDSIFVSDDKAGVIYRLFKK